MKAANVFIMVLLCAAFAGCATRPVVPAGEKNAAWDRHRDQVLALTSWQASGRISIRLEHQAWSATLQWQQQPREYFLRLIAPLGQGTYEITGNSAGVFLRTARNEVYKAADAETLMQGTLGWSVPLKGLAYWIRGVPVPGTRAPLLHLDDQGRITDLSQSGWRASYSAYNDTGGYILPGRIALQNNRLKVRLVIKHWDIQDGAAHE